MKFIAWALLIGGSLAAVVLHTVDLCDCASPTLWEALRSFAPGALESAVIAAPKK